MGVLFTGDFGVQGGRIVKDRGREVSDETGKEPRTGPGRPRWRRGGDREVDGVRTGLGAVRGEWEVIASRPFG